MVRLFNYSATCFVEIFLKISGTDKKVGYISQIKKYQLEL